MQKIGNKSLSIAMILIAGVSWGTMSIFKTGLQEVGFSTLDSAAIRTVFTSIVLFIIILIINPKLLKIEWKDLPVFLGLGIVGGAVCTLCTLGAIEILKGASVPSLLLNTSPIFVMIIAAIFFKEKITLKKVIALILALVGVACVSGVFSVNSDLPPVGILVGIMSGLAYATYSVLAKKIATKYNSLTINFYTFFIATLIVLPASTLLSNLNMLATGSAIFNSLGLVIICTVLPFVLYSTGLKSINVSIGSVLAMSEPLTATVVGLTFMGEGVTPAKIIGIVLVITAIVVLNLNLEKKDKEKTARQNG